MAIGPDGQAVVPLSGPRAASPAELAALRQASIIRQIAQARSGVPEAGVDATSGPDLPYLERGQVRTPWGFGKPNPDALAQIEALKAAFVQRIAHQANQWPMWDERRVPSIGNQYKTIAGQDTPFGEYTPPGGQQVNPEAGFKLPSAVEDWRGLGPQNPPNPRTAGIDAYFARRDRILRAHGEALPFGGLT